MPPPPPMPHNHPAHAPWTSPDSTLLRAHTLHTPHTLTRTHVQRPAGSIGLVIERARSTTEVESLRWYVKDSTEILYHEWFYCSDLGTALPPVFARFFASENFKTGASAWRACYTQVMALAVAHPGLVGW